MFASGLRLPPRARHKHPYSLWQFPKQNPSNSSWKRTIEGQRFFGENYVQELIEKVSQMPPDVHWHFIGTLQSNKVNGLIKSVFPNKAASLTVQTVATLKLATKLNAAMQEYEHHTLPIFVQVNTSELRRAVSNQTKW
jgi:uncharacterized pyridoxal phosphate-containing UPF0001 family protein